MSRYNPRFTAKDRASRGLKPRTGIAHRGPFGDRSMGIDGAQVWRYAVDAPIVPGLRCMVTLDDVPPIHSPKWCRLRRAIVLAVDPGGVVVAIDDPRDGSWSPLTVDARMLIGPAILDHGIVIG